MRIDAPRLRAFLDCMHEEADERDKRSKAISEIVKAAKDAGFDTRAVRKVFVRERMDEGERARQDDLLETYEAALGPKGRALKAIEAGAGVGEAADAHRVHRATLARARKAAADVANEPSNATPHDPDTGEIIETALPAVASGDGEAPDLRGSAGTPSPIIEAGGNAPAVGKEADHSAPDTPRPVGEAEIADRSNDTDDLTPPPFLRRVKVAA